jgi:hypothetical protein
MRWDFERHCSSGLASFSSDSEISAIEISGGLYRMKVGFDPTGARGKGRKTLD